MKNDGRINASEGISISWARLSPFVWVSLLAPALIFCFAWMRAPLGVLASLAIIAIGFFVIRESMKTGTKIPFFTNLVSSENNLRETILSKRSVLLFALVAILWCLLSGQGGIMPQSSDWSSRNAIYRDLVNLPWPVFYDGGQSALAYYFAYWLPPAIFGKMAAFAGLDAGTVWIVAKASLFIWTAWLVFLTEISVSCILGIRSRKEARVMTALLVCFAGMDFLGFAICFFFGTSELQAFEQMVLSYIHLDGWDDPFQFSSMTTQLFWVFNQAIPAWLCTCVLLAEKRASSYCAIIMVCFACAPFPAVGITVLAIGLYIIAIRKATGNAGCWKTAKTLISAQNVLSIPIGLCFVFFFMSNAVVGNTGAEGSGTSFITLPSSVSMLAFYLLAFVFEAGIYIFLVRQFKGRASSNLLALITVPLLIVPFVHVGTSYDFCMRASIPFLFVLMLMCYEPIASAFLPQNGIKSTDKKSIERKQAATMLTICLIIGFMTPCAEVARGITAIINEGYQTATVEQFDDISGLSIGEQSNFKTPVSASSIWFSKLSA